MRITKLGVAFALTLCCCAMWVPAQDLPDLRGVSKIHQFRLWGTFDSTEKLVFLSGFMNGLITGVGMKECSDKSKEPLLDCVLVDKDPSLDQAVAMVDKYFKQNPEKWNIPIGDAVFEALTVKEGPCGKEALKNSR